MPVIDLGTFDITASPPLAGGDPRKEYLNAPNGPLDPNKQEPTKPVKASSAPASTQGGQEETTPKATTWEGTNAALGDLHREQMEAPPTAPQLPKPPQQKGLNDLQGQISGWGALAIAIGALASLKTRQPMTTAMNAAAAAMTSMQQGNQEAFEAQYKQWQDSTKTAIEMTKLEQNSYQLAMEGRNQEALIKLKAQAQAREDPAMDQEIKRGELEHPNDPVEAMKYARQLADKREADANRIKESTENVQKGIALNKSIKEMEASPEFQQASQAKRSEMYMQKIAESGTGAARWLATGQFDEQSLDGMAKLIEAGKYPFPTATQIGRYPSMAQVAKKVLEDRPDINPQDYSLVLDARKKLQGKDGDVVRSFTVLLQHLAFLDQLGKNLQDAGINRTDSPAANSIIAKVAKQFGMTQITDFEAVKQFVGDESVKAILGASVGGVTDRAEAEKIFNIGNTPAQMLSTTHDVRELAKGQLTGVVSKYRYFLNKGLLQPEDIVPQDTLDALHVHVDTPQNLFRPQGRDVFDQLDGGNAKIIPISEGVSVESPGTEKVSDKPIFKSQKPSPEELKSHAPSGWSGDKKDAAVGPDGTVAYHVNGRWIDSSGNSVSGQ